MITAQEIQQLEAHRRNLKKETYKHILETFDKKIRSAVAMSFPKVLLEVPSFVWGFPMYNIDSAASYLKRQLVNLGYTVKQNDYVFEVTWGKAQLIKPEMNDIDEEDLPSLINLRKIASKIIQQSKNGGGSRGS